MASRWLQVDTYYSVAENMVSTAIFVAIALVIEALLETIIRTACNIARRKIPGAVRRQKKIDTLQSILLSTARYTVSLIAAFKILLLWGVSSQSLTVGSAVIGGAIGFGSQGLVQDVITGLGLLFEDQLRIGDYVQIGDKKGYVRSVGLRIVKLEDSDGNVHILFNRNIATVSNLTPPPSKEEPTPPSAA